MLDVDHHDYFLLWGIKYIHQILLCCGIVDKHLVRASVIIFVLLLLLICMYII